jgi:hypothetical protein
LVVGPLVVSAEQRSLSYSASHPFHRAPRRFLVFLSLPLLVRRDDFLYYYLFLVFARREDFLYYYIFVSSRAATIFCTTI